MNMNIGLVIVFVAGLSGWAEILDAQTDSSPNPKSFIAEIRQSSSVIVQPLGSAGILPTLPGGSERLPSSQGELGEILRFVEKDSGIRFLLSPDLAQDPIQGSFTTMDMISEEAIQSLLKGYNFLAESDDSGRTKAVIVTGRNGDGTMPPKRYFSGSDSNLIHLLTDRASFSRLPEAYRHLRPGSVRAVDVSVEQLRDMPKGTRVLVDLPGGRYTAIHDNKWQHEDGESTWVGYLADQGESYRAILTFGKNGVEGQILTPEGLYWVESQEGQTWLIDIGASGLQRGTFEADERIPEFFPPTDSGGSVMASNPSVSPMPWIASTSILPERVAARANEKMTTPDERERSYSAQATIAGDGRAVIDVLVLYTNGFSSSRFTTQLNQVVTFANQAYLDSRAQVTLRVVKSKLVDYPNGTDNNLALDDLINHVGPFRSVPSLRVKKGADLVVLLRPFKPRSQNGCGSAWVNGANGSELAADLAFTVVSLGARDGYYCSKYALAHEIGHVLGSTHDREHSSVAGRYSYSYGYGIEGRFGDIMSYYDPEIGLFANPDLVSCDGLPCGKPISEPDAADVAQTFNNTAKTISGFSLQKFALGQ